MLYYTPEIYIKLLANVTPLNLIKNKKRNVKIGKTNTLCCPPIYTDQFTFTRGKKHIKLTILTILKSRVQ